MTTDTLDLVAAKPTAQVLEQALVGADLSKLTTEQRLAFYNSVCNSLGLNPLTKPFSYINLNGKLTLYALRDCTDQLRKINNVSVEILERQRIDDLCVVRTRATLPSGRADESLGAVPLAGLRGEALANALMKAECVPFDSEILTHDGWKTWDRAVIGEHVLAYDVATDTTAWTPLIEVTAYKATPTIRLFSTARQFEVVCTPNHSWAVAKKPYAHAGTGARPARGAYANRKPDRALVEAREVNTSHRLILSAPEMGVPDEASALTPTEAAILGWAVTDGTIQRRGTFVRLGICQSKEENFEPIRELTAAVGASEIISPARSRTFPMTGRTYDTKPQHWWYLPAAVSRDLLEKAGFESRADLPLIVTRLSSTARRAMLQAFMLAEGDKKQIFANTDRDILDTLEILCALEGIATGKEVTRVVPGGSIQTVRVKKTRHVAGAFLHSEDAGIRDVWCPTTKYGTWIMRQNGRVMITGNTKAKRRVTLSICGLGWLDETEVDSIHQQQPERFRGTTMGQLKAEEAAAELPIADAETVNTETGEITAHAAKPAEVLPQDSYRVENVWKEKSGTKNGRQWNLWMVQCFGQDKPFSTFDDDLAGAANRCREDGNVAEILTEVKKYGLEILTFTVKPNPADDPF